MKTSIKLLIGLLLAGSLLASCESDDENNESNNFLKVGDTEYDLSAGLLENYGMDEDSTYLGYNTDLTLISEGFSIEVDEDGNWEMSGSGDAVYFEMFSSNGTTLDDHDYTFATTGAIGTFSYGLYALGLDVENDGDYEDFQFITSGTVSVSTSGSEYTIEIDCYNEEGVKVTGYYKGTLQLFDWTTVEPKSATLKSSQRK